jgi:hypothetical protein
MKFLTPAPLALFPEIAENRSTEYFLRIHQCLEQAQNKNGKILEMGLTNLTRCIIL